MSHQKAKKAVLSYEMWHQKNPKELKEISVNWPKEVYACGRAEQIIYRSDKWEKDKDFYTYDHVFDTRPTVFCATESILSDTIQGGPRSVAKLLGVRDVNKDPVAAPALANTLELTVSFPDGSGKTLYFKNTPVLCCTSDLKTLIICAKNDIIFIRGGKMHVTERGIVK